MFNTIEELIAQFDKAVDLVQNHPVKGPIQYNLAADGYVAAVSYYLDINGVDVVAHKGTVNNPISTLECPASDYLDLRNGKVSYSDLLKSKKLKLLGDQKNLLLLGRYMVK